MEKRVLSRQFSTWIRGVPFWIAQVAALLGYMGLKGEKWSLWSVRPHPLKSQHTGGNGAQGVGKACSKLTSFNLEKGCSFFQLAQVAALLGDMG